MATGFADSSIRVWDLTGTGLRSMISSELLDPDARTWDSVLEPDADKNKRLCRTLVGHSGPVYAVRFSPDNQV